MTNNDDATQPSGVVLPPNWVDYVKQFADILGKNVDDVTAMLRPIVGEPGDQAIELLKDASMSPDDMIKGVLNGTPVAVANKAIKTLRESVVVNATTAALAMNAIDILPAAPADESWLSALRAGGILKVEQSTVVSAVRAALAQRVNLYGVPDMLVKRMEVFADENAEPVPEEFFKLRRLLTRRSYAEIFEAIEGLDGSFVTDVRKKVLVDRIDANLWPALISFHSLLKGWVDAWQQGAANPAMLMNAVMAIAGGGSGAMPPGMMAPPDTGTLRDSADAFNDEINKIFAGTGIQIAGAMAFDASRIKQILENPRLPALIGAANRDQMLRQLGVEVSATYPRLEANLVRYVLSIMKIKDLTAGNEELQFFSSLYMLGSQIPWDQLSMGARANNRSH
ncbi:MAG: hypothetical protein V4436_01535 [Patescibacteria group bacterium]